MESSRSSSSRAVWPPPAATAVGGHAAARRHHLIDPATGRPADGDLARVTIVASSAAEAEVLPDALPRRLRRGHGAGERRADTRPRHAGRRTPLAGSSEERSHLLLVPRTLDGLVAYALLTTSVVAGLVLKARPYGTSPKPAAVTDLHRFLALLGLGALVVHGLALLLDRTVPFHVADLLVPGIAPYRPVWTGLGVLAAELMLLVYVSALAAQADRRELAPPALGHVSDLRAGRPGLLAGTDSGTRLGAGPLRRNGRRRLGRGRLAHRRPPSRGLRSFQAASRVLRCRLAGKSMRPSCRCSDVSAGVEFFSAGRRWARSAVRSDHRPYGRDHANPPAGRQGVAWDSPHTTADVGRVHGLSQQPDKVAVVLERRTNLVARAKDVEVVAASSASRPVRSRSRRNDRDDPRRIDAALAALKPTHSGARLSGQGEERPNPRPGGDVCDRGR